MTIAWVIGSGGLLGAALSEALRRDGKELFSPVGRFAWSDEALLVTQMSCSIQAFAVKARACDGWQVYWAAGVGVMGSSEDSLKPETRALGLLLRLLAADPLLNEVPGAVAFCSSAGAIYAGSSEIINTENTPPAPTTAYAREKLQQEALLGLFSIANNQASVLISRLSTIYGPGQAAGKQQGLLTHVARRIVRNQPIQIYVPYDTIRDYIAVADAADAMVEALSGAGQRSGAQIQIIASETPTTIAEIIAIFNRIARRAPRIVTSANKMSSLYPRSVQFRSVVSAKSDRPKVTSLAIGIAQLMMAERKAYVRGR